MIEEPMRRGTARCAPTEADTSDLPDLPKGWVWTTLGDIVRQVHKTDPRSNPECDFLYLDIASIDNEQQRIVQPKEYNGRDAPSRAKQLVESGDILFSTVRTYLKNIAVVDERYHGQIASTGFCVIRAFDLTTSRLLFYWVQTGSFLSPLSGIQRGTSYPAVRDSDVLRQPVPLPPLPEQHRIVAKIEELLTELDAGVEALKKVKTQMKRYRQAVLKHAFEGRLTEEWRQAHKGEIEPASVLLERVRVEREKNGVRRGRRGTARCAPTEVDTSDLPDLPEGWAWIRVADITERMQYGTSEKAGHDPTGIPVLRMGNIRNGELSFHDLKYYPAAWLQAEAFILEDGDVLFNRTNSAELVGKSAVYEAGHPRAVFASYLIRLRVNRAVYEPNMVSYFINSIAGRRYISSVVSQQVGQANVNSAKLSMMPVPFPAPPEQRRIIEEIERRFSIAVEIDKAVEQALKQSDRLRQSILKRAFEGKLVPQDTNDEPAERLLERIKQANVGAQRAVPLRGMR